MKSWKEKKSDPAYRKYHNEVVDACVLLTREGCRKFYDSMTYLDEFDEGLPVDEVAEANVDATDWES